MVNDDKLKEIESRLTELIEHEMHYARRTTNPMPFLLLDLTREVIKLQQEVAKEPRDWGKMHT